MLLSNAVNNIIYRLKLLVRSYQHPLFGVVKVLVVITPLLSITLHVAYKYNILKYTVCFTSTPIQTFAKSFLCFDGQPNYIFFITSDFEL